MTPTGAERACWHIGDQWDRRYRAGLLRPLTGAIANKAADYYLAVEARAGKAAANVKLRELCERIKESVHNVAANDDALCERADRRAHQCRKAAARAGRTAAARVVEGDGLTPPGEKIDDAPAVARMVDDGWWRRGLRRKHGREYEGAAIWLGLVHKRAGLYVSDDTVKRRTDQKTRNRRILESLQAVNELDQSFTLQELSDLSVSNPVIRRGELMTRIAGFEQCAERAGHVGQFITWTCPSRMHARLHESGQRNPHYDETTPREAQKYLAGQWAKARAAIKRAGWYVYGFRIAEPHHDGTPHWHLLLFTPPEHAPGVLGVMRRYALQVDGDEAGADKYRFKAVEIDRSKGTAAGYVAKYVAKNIDGYGVNVDLFGKDPAASAKRVDAWASTWGIRQFQQIGGPSVTVWRELRRLSDGAPAGAIGTAWAAADGGDWAAYVAAQGGIETPRNAQPVTLARAWSDKPGKYGEPVGWRVVGVESGAVRVPSRFHVWAIDRRPRSPVNNCTGCNREQGSGIIAGGVEGRESNARHRVAHGAESGARGRAALSEDRDGRGGADTFRSGADRGRARPGRGVDVARAAGGA